MKKIIGFIPTWATYYIGHWACLLERFLAPRKGILWLYMLSQWCLVKSGDIQDWAGLDGPWMDVTPPEDKPKNLEIERRWLLTELPDLKWNDLLYIKQYYTPGGRFRQIFNGTIHTYFHTIKHNIAPGINEEDEKEITKEEFDLAITKAISYIEKHRYIYKVDNLKYEFDAIITTLNNIIPTLWILEIELESIDQPLELIPIVTCNVIKEITGDKSYSNFSLSHKL